LNRVTYTTAGARNFGEQMLDHAEVWGPRILAAVLILLVGYLLAQAAKWSVAALVNRTRLAKRANDPAHHARHPQTIGAQVGDAAFWVVLLLALFLAAQPLGLAAGGPLGQMLNQFGATVPRIIGAGLILFLGYVLASVARKAVEAVITATHVERLSNRVGHLAPADPTALPRTLGGIVFALIIIPAAIAALDTLAIAAISQPATAMLRIILDAIPRVIAAGLILALAYVVGRFASRLLTQFLATTGFDRTIASLGLFAGATAAAPPRVTVDGEPLPVTTVAAPGAVTPSRAAGTAVFVAILVFGLMEAFRQLRFAYGSRIMAEILALFGQVVFGAVIITAGVVIARFVARAIEASGGEGARLAAGFTRVAIIVLGAAIGLRFMGLADDIIQLAFGLILGAIAVAAAIAFGLGGREPAARLLQRLSARIETQIDTDPNAPVPPAQRSRTIPPAPPPRV
jgi:hypothetical protein